MATTICMLNFKGGVGKTTTTLNLSAALANMGKKILVIDLDLQCNVTKTYKKDSPYEGSTIYEFLTGKDEEIRTYETTNPNLHYVPSSDDMRYIEMELNRRREREHILRRFIDVVDSAYDIIILDCPPGKSIVTDNALVAAQKIIIPIKCEIFSMQGLGDMLSEIADVRKFSNKDVEILGILANEFDGRTIINRQIMEELRNSFPGLIFDTTIRRNVHLCEFSNEKQSIFDYMQCKGADDYTKLAEEVINKLSMSN